MARHLRAGLTAGAVALAAVLAVPGLAMASSANVSVSGQANPFTAGQTAGFACCGGDVTPGQSPTLVPLVVAGGDVLSFAATGLTDGAGTGATGPDGAYVFDMADYGTGVAGADGVTVLSLVGVFLDASTPSLGTQPGRLNFNVLGLNFAALAPGLGQIFFIGDGVDSSSVTQLFTAPTGATRLFLGTVDGFQWNNNSGAYDVTVNLTAGNGGDGVPEPAAWALMIAGFGMAGASLRHRRAVAPA